MMVFISATGVFCHYELLGTLRSDDGDGNENGQKAIGLIIVKQQLCTCHHAFFLHFLAVVARLQRKNA